MATYAEYSAQTMAANDFTLYPYQEWNNEQTYLPTSTYQDQSYMSATSFDSFGSQQAYAHLDQFTFPGDQTFQPKNSLQPPSPRYSPSHSTSHSFDPHNPPFFSSTSDSGASVQSTLSSAIGSPSAHPQQTNDWQPQGIGMLPGIVHQDSFGHDIFAPASFDIESIPAIDKGCVGELAAISYSQSAQNLASLNLPPFSSSLDFLRESNITAHQPSHDLHQLRNALHATGVRQPLSIPPMLASQAHGSVESTSPNDSLFKSPTTPASAAATSPLLERVRGKRKASVALSAAKRARSSSPLTQAVSYHETDLPARPHAPAPMMASPFFSQSSGHFVPPLDYSCPSPSSLFRISFYAFLWRLRWKPVLTKFLQIPR